MKKITNESVNAFMNGKNFKKQNMEVRNTENMIRLYLHGNMIAWYHKGHTSFYISNCGWKSNTTKERLNSLPKVYIQQKQGVWYLNGETWDGQTKEINLINQVL